MDRFIPLEINIMLRMYNPERIKFCLKTYTVRSNALHYNPHTGKYWEGSPDETTYRESFSAEYIASRLEVLKSYNFEMTEYQYNCNDQRKLMNAELRNKIIYRDSRVCQICGKYCSMDEIQIDHIQPVSKGGKTVESNLQVLCAKCNRTKSNKYTPSIISYNPKEKHIVESVGSSLYSSVPQINYSRVQIGDEVVIKYMGEDKTRVFLLSGDCNASFERGVISVSSPLGCAVFSKTKGCILAVRTPTGDKKIQIIDIKKATQER